MQNLGLVYRPVTVYDLAEVGNGLVLREGPVGLDLACQVASLAELGYDEDHAVAVVLRQDLHHVGPAPQLPEEVQLEHQFLFFEGVAEIGLGVAFEDEGREIGVDGVECFVSPGLLVG